MKGNTVIPQRLTAARQNLGLNQEQFAMRIREFLPLDKTVSTVNVSTWETGRRNVPKAYRDAICKALDVSVEYLTGTSDEDIKQREQPLDEKLELIGLDDLYLYNEKPVYVEFVDYSKTNGWALYSKEKNKLIFCNYTMTLYPKYLKNGSLRLYASNPYYNVNSNEIYKKRLDLRVVMRSRQVFVIMNSMDKEIQNLYNGWYKHNETRTALISEIGNALPYTGLGISYNAYSSID